MDGLSKTPHDDALDPGNEGQLDSEALYTRGMAHYRRREWQRAMEYFVRLKSLEPNRPGIDALLDELDWFIQLQAMGPESQPAEAEAEAVSQVVEPEVREVPPPRVRTRPAGRWLKWQWVIFPLVIIALAVVAYVLFTLPQTDPIQVLYNQAQARMSVGDYEGAIQAFDEILARDPNHKGAQFGLEKARRQANLRTLYQNAKTYIANEQWELASAELNKILEIDPSYADASTLAETVESRRSITALYEEGKKYFQDGAWAMAIDRLLRVRDRDSLYEDANVRQMLYTAYVSEGVSLLADSNSGVSEIRKAIQHFSSALTLRPQNQEVADLKRDAEVYLAGYTAYESKEWDLAIARFKSLHQTKPDYAKGNLAKLLYGTYIHRGDAYRDAERFAEALADYRAAQKLGLADSSLAQGREQEILTKYFTPTPTATRTRTPTRTAAPTKTSAPATATPVVTQPPPPPPSNTPKPPTPTSGPVTPTKPSRP
jgi:tetratricopeptide (TPR) repeat protein